MSGHEIPVMPSICELPSLREQAHFHEIGIEIDSLGRPLHPWRDQLHHLAEGKGFYWQWGPNYTVDPIVISRDVVPKILLVRRGDNGMWALPGGFIDGEESAPTAGRRELEEETGFTLATCEPTLCYQGPVLDQRSRLNAWSDTTALLWHCAEIEAVRSGDDAIDAQWVPLSQLRDLGALHGSHATLIDMAIRDHGSLHEQLEYFGELSEITQAKGGHMGYTRLVASIPDGRRIFVKRYDAHKFSDPVRAEHSKRYLRKEHHVYTQLQHATPHIPRRIELIEDHTLLLEAYDARDGWHWKAPTDIEMRRAYIEDIIEALHALGPISYKAFDEINPTYQTIYDEGWGAFPTQRKSVIAKLRASDIAGCDELADHIDELYKQAMTHEMPELTHFAHYDIRQSNIAWHPEHGVRIVDWSWADHAPQGMDTTSFLIDLAKAGHDVNGYLEDFNPDHALLLIGFWLGHSIWPTPTSDQTVRTHQMGSAITAYTLLKRLCE